jgi:hypothetical protein
MGKGAISSKGAQERAEERAAADAEAFAQAQEFWLRGKQHGNAGRGYLQLAQSHVREYDARGTLGSLVTAARRLAEAAQSCASARVELSRSRAPLSRCGRE